MACTALTKGRGLDCNRISGGIKYVYFGVYDQTDIESDTLEATGDSFSTLIWDTELSL